MTDSRTYEQKRALEKKIRIKFGMLEVYEHHLAVLCHREYLKRRVKSETQEAKVH